MTVGERLGQVRARIDAAARAAGREPGEVRLVAVSKRQPLERVFAAYDAGHRDFGENVAQELRDKAEAFAGSGRGEVRWHFIGHVQRNKVNTVLKHAAVIQTVDREGLADALAKRAPEGGVRVMVEVNVGDEPQKSGVRSGEAVTFARRVGREPRLDLIGLMCIPPADGDPDPHFRRLAEIKAELRATEEGRGASELSMGMSADFETAIARGATLVRIGTGVFGPRETRGH